MNKCKECGKTVSKADLLHPYSGLADRADFREHQRTKDKPTVYHMPMEFEVDELVTMVWREREEVEFYAARRLMGFDDFALL